MFSVEPIKRSPLQSPEAVQAVVFWVAQVKTTEVLASTFKVP
jgi:hypothetical protein